MIKILFVFLNTFIFILCFFTIKAQANEIILKNCYQVKLEYPGGIVQLLLEKKQLDKELEKKSMQIQDLKRYDDIIRNLGLSEEKLKNLRDSIYDDKKFNNSLYKDYRFIFDFKNITVKRITSFKDEIFEKKNKEFFGTLSKEEVTIFKFKELIKSDNTPYLNHLKNYYIFDEDISGKQYDISISPEYSLIDSSKLGIFLCSKN